MAGQQQWKDWTATSAGTEWKDAFYSFANLQEKAKPAAEEIDGSSSWKDVEMDPQREAAAKLVLEQEIQELTEEEKRIYEENSAKYWNEFYAAHNHQFFRPRNYLPNEFPEVILQSDPSATERGVVVEFGCGNGSSFYPLIEYNKEVIPRPIVYGLDFSSAAIEHLRNKEGFDVENSRVLVHDLVKDELVDDLRVNKIDVALLVFVLSAIDPAHMQTVANRLYQSLKPGGILLFRDYGIYDMTQLRFVAKKKRKLQESFYVRGDGTRTYFFELEFVRQLFSNAGFEIVTLRYDTRELKNRKRMLTMYRNWITAKFRKPVQ